MLLLLLLQIMTILINYDIYYDDSIPTKRINDQHALSWNASRKSSSSLVPTDQLQPANPAVPSPRTQYFNWP